MLETAKLALGMYPKHQGVITKQLDAINTVRHLQYGRSPWSVERHHDQIADILWLERRHSVADQNPCATP